MANIIDNGTEYHLLTDAEPTSRKMQDPFEDYDEWSALAEDPSGKTVKVYWIFSPDEIESSGGYAQDLPWDSSISRIESL